jgi:RNA polymerase sigma factor (sigma-70 family)
MARKGPLFIPLDLMGIGDEQLIVLLRGGKCQEAREELVLRYLPWTRRVAIVFATSARLPKDSVADVRQIASMALLEAISKYDPARAEGAGRCSFRTFLFHVFRNRFRDFLKKTRRAERRYDRSLAAAFALEEGAGQTAKKQRGWSIDVESDDPALVVQQHEEMARLVDAVNVLSSSKHMIWKRVCEGDNLQAIAKELGISYDATRRRLQKTLKLLKRHVEGRVKS